MKTLFIANLKLNANEGIYKKIYAEATAIGNTVGDCTLVMPNFNTSIMINTKDKISLESDKDVLKTAKRLILENDINLIYIRLMIPSFELYLLLKLAYMNKIKILYEIPTYPYYNEQFRASRKKYRAVVKICIDIFFSPIIKKYADKIVVIKSKSKIKMHPKMIEITNGINTDPIIPKNYKNDSNSVFRMVAIGTLYSYHGYDRILKGLKKCDEKIDGIPIEFHIIGESQTINELNQQTKKLKLKRVFFHGLKTTEELNDMFELFDVGLGCLALHRRNADIDTTLKIIEYYCRGIPVVTSGISPYKDNRVTIRIPDNNDAVKIEDIYYWWKDIDKTVLEKLSVNAKKQFDWNIIMSNLIEQCYI